MRWASRSFYWGLRSVDTVDTKVSLCDTEVENNLLFIEDVERWLDENRRHLDNASGGCNPFAGQIDHHPSGALTTEELFDALHQA